MKHKNLSPFFLPGLLVSFIVILADQYTKWWVFESILRVQGEGPSFVQWLTHKRPLVDFIAHQNDYGNMAMTSFFSLVTVWNQGVSFGLFGQGGLYMPWVLMGVAVVISGALLGFLAQAERKIMALAVSLIIGGALGNVYDRIRFGAVADFLDLHWRDYHWPAFNLADSCVVLGAILLMADAILYKETETKVSS